MLDGKNKRKKWFFYERVSAGRYDLHIFVERHANKISPLPQILFLIPVPCLPQPCEGVLYWSKIGKYRLIPACPRFESNSLSHLGS